jgi:hypothetical protein
MRRYDPCLFNTVFRSKYGVLIRWWRLDPCSLIIPGLWYDTLLRGLYSNNFPCRCICIKMTKIIVSQGYHNPVFFLFGLETGEFHLKCMIRVVSDSRDPFPLWSYSPAESKLKINTFHLVAHIINDRHCIPGQLASVHGSCPVWSLIHSAWERKSDNLNPIHLTSGTWPPSPRQ